MTATLNLDSFRAMVGKDNYGEVRLNQNGQLEKINNHYLQREWNVGRQKPTRGESLYIRQSFLNAVAEAKVDENILNKIKVKLGLSKEQLLSNATDKISESALARHTIAEVLDMVDQNVGDKRIKKTLGDNKNIKDFEFVGDERTKALFRTFTTEFANVFGYKEAFGETQFSNEKYAKKNEQGVNLTSMKKGIKHWNGQHTKAEDKINLSDDQLKVLFNRHGVELKNAVVGRLMNERTQEHDTPVKTNIDDPRYATSNLICEEILKTLKKEKLDRGETSLGVQGETRTGSDNKKLDQYLEQLRKETGINQATSVYSMSTSGIAKFCNNCTYQEVNDTSVASGKSAITQVPEDVIFEKADFETEIFNNNENLESVKGQTLNEVCRLPMEVVLNGSDGKTLKTVKFERAVGEANKNSNSTRADNEKKLNDIMDEIGAYGILRNHQPLEKMLWKSMGQKFVAAATTKLYWNDTDADRKLFLNMNKDGSFSVSLHFKTSVKKNFMQFDYKIHANGDVDREYLGKRKKVAAQTDGKNTKVEHKDIPFPKQEKVAAQTVGKNTKVENEFHNAPMTETEKEFQNLIDNFD